MSDFPSTRASLLLRLRDPQDQAAWREFVTIYAPLVYGYLRKQGLQDADAADLCQEVLAAVAGAVGRLHYDPNRGFFRNWLFTMVRHKLLDWRRLFHHRLLGSGDTGTHKLLDQLPAPDTTEVEWHRQWERRLFAWACEQVRPHVTDATWQAFWRTSVDGEPSQQVAVDLGLTVAAVYHARGRVLARLKELVQSVQDT
jgi:RNA polymerase sigma-70 factor (ECF subfamily)